MTTEALRMRNRAHTALKRAVDRGLIHRQPCEVCGDELAHGHHEDYTKVLEVKWLCYTHHQAEHRRLGWGITGRKRTHPPKPYREVKARPNYPWPSGPPQPGVCTCGCKRKFKPTRSWQKYATKACGDRVRIRRLRARQKETRR
jgi:hypothetical protein